jgi:hypothetical protein
MHAHTCCALRHLQANAPSARSPLTQSDTTSAPRKLGTTAQHLFRMASRSDARGVVSYSPGSSVPPRTTVSAGQTHTWQCTGACLGQPTRCHWPACMPPTDCTPLLLPPPTHTHQMSQSNSSTSPSNPNTPPTLTPVGNDVALPPAIGVVAHPRRPHPHHLPAHGVHRLIPEEHPRAQACRAQRQGCACMGPGVGFHVFTRHE